MLGQRGHAQAYEGLKLADGCFPFDESAEYEEARGVSQRLQQASRTFGVPRHLGWVWKSTALRLSWTFHTSCIYA